MLTSPLPWHWLQSDNAWSPTGEELCVNFSLFFFACRSSLALSGVRELSSRYRGTPHLAQVRLLHLELLLSNQQVGAAKELVEDIITGT